TFIAEVKKCWDRDPDALNNACQIPFHVRDSFLLVRGVQSKIWIEFRLQPPVFTNVPWVSGTAYTPGAVVYYDTTGECYVNTAATNSAAPTTAANWRKVDFPYIFAEYTAESVYAAMVGKEEESQADFAIEQTAGWPYLQAELE